MFNYSSQHQVGNPVCYKVHASRQMELTPCQSFRFQSRISLLLDFVSGDLTDKEIGIVIRKYPMTIWFRFTHSLSSKVLG